MLSKTTRVLYPIVFCDGIGFNSRYMTFGLGFDTLLYVTFIYGSILTSLLLRRSPLKLCWPLQIFLSFFASASARLDTSSGTSVRSLSMRVWIRFIQSAMFAVQFETLWIFSWCILVVELLEQTHLAIRDLGSYVYYKTTKEGMVFHREDSYVLYGPKFLKWFFHVPAQ